MSDNTLQYISGKGWLIFSGGNRAGSPTRAKALTRASGFGTTVYISLADDGGDALMDDMEDLGGRTGYFIDLLYDQPETIKEEMEAATMVVIEVGSSIDALYNALQGAPLATILAAYQRGAVILIEGLAVNLFGRWVVSDSGDLLDGFDWVKNTFIEPESTSATESRAVQAVLNQIDDAMAVNIGVGSALVLGQSQVEVWGDEVTISLGRTYAADQDE